MTAVKGAKVWAELNERQRLYLSTIFGVDQAAEANIRARSARWERTPTASEWRQVTYDIKVPKGRPARRRLHQRPAHPAAAGRA